MNPVLPFPQRPVAVTPSPSLPLPEELAGGAVYEPQFDGRRALLFVEHGVCRIQSGRGVDITDAFPEVAAAAVQWLPGGVVIDGEIMIWGSGRADFGEFQRRLSGQDDVTSLHRATVSFVAFDVLAGAGMDMRSSPFRVRRHALEILLGDALPPLHLVPQTRSREQAQGWLHGYTESRVGIDGVVAKGKATPYERGEAGWQKVGIHDSTKFVVWAVVGDVHQPTHLLLATSEDDGVLRHAGWTTAVPVREGHLLGRLLVPTRGDHPWPEYASTSDLPGWRGPTESLQLTDPHLVVEATTGAGGATVTFIRQRPDLQVEDLVSG